MVHFGWNAGPHHARVHGLAKGYTKSLDHATMADHDNREDLLLFGVELLFVCPDIIQEGVDERVPFGFVGAIEHGGDAGVGNSGIGGPSVDGV